MEARATLRGPRVSRTLVAGVLVVVALGVGAVGGYVAAGLGGAKVASPGNIAPIAKTVPDQGKAVLPDWIVQEITPKTAPAQRILTDDIIRNAKPATAPAAAACPAGTHLAIWYTVRATGCVSDTAGRQAREEG